MNDFGIVLSKVNGRILAINHTGCKLLENSNLVGTNARDLYVDPSQRDKIVSEVKKKILNGVGEYHIDIKCGNKVKTLAISMMKFGNGKRDTLLTVFTEVK